LHDVSYGQDIDVVQLLLEHGADVDSRNFGDETPLHLVSEAGCTKTIKLLPDHGADVNNRMR
jgi:ankyrin repeat protein